MLANFLPIIYISHIMVQRKGKIVIPPGCNIWPHELETAKALANFGHTIEFKKKIEGYKVHSADAFVDGILWEFKAPDGGKIDIVERNLRRAKIQSGHVVFDSKRVKKIPDAAIKREILAKAPLIKDICAVIFVDRKRRCIDIYKKKA